MERLNAGFVPTLWANRPLNELLNSLLTPRWDNEEEPKDMENRTLIQVSESTQKVIKVAFGMQLSNPARLQVRKRYPFTKTQGVPSWTG